MVLIDERHPAFSGLIAIWRARRRGERPPPASSLDASTLAELASMTVMLAADDGNGLIIIDSGEAVDALYGASLAGGAAVRLSPERDDAEQEARAAIATGRPLLIEDELRGSKTRRRIARLYLPLANDDGSPDGVLCGVVAVA